MAAAPLALGFRAILVSARIAHCRLEREWRDIQESSLNEPATVKQAKVIRAAVALVPVDIQRALTLEYELGFCTRMR